MAYKKGRYLTADIEKAYFYFRVCLLFKCKCGPHANEYHNKTISNVYLCYPFESECAINSLNLPNSLLKKYAENFNEWMRANIR